jgi:hypothetical protein
VVVNARHGFRQVQNLLEELVGLFFGGSFFELEQDNVFNLRHGVRVVFFGFGSSFIFWGIGIQGRAGARERKRPGISPGPFAVS